MNLLGKRTAAALIYAVLAYVGAIGVWNAHGSAIVDMAFFAWNVACAIAFAYMVIRISRSVAAFAIVVVLFGSALQVATVNVMVAGAFGQPLGSALLDMPGSLARTMVRDPILYMLWFGIPVLAAGTVLYFKRGLGFEPE